VQAFKHSAQVPRIERWFRATARPSCCTAHGRTQPLQRAAPSPLKIALSHVGMVPIYDNDSIGPSEPTTQTKSR